MKSPFPPSAPAHWVLSRMLKDCIKLLDEPNTLNAYDRTDVRCWIDLAGPKLDTSRLGENCIERLTVMHQKHYE